MSGIGVRCGFGAAAVAVSVAGCGAASSGGTTSGHVGTPDPSRSTATVAQYASIVATNRPKIAKVYREIRNCSIIFTSLCGIEGVTAEATTESLLVELRAAQHQRPNNHLYIGAPPAAITGIVADTQRAAEQVMAAGRAIHHPSRAADFDRMQFALSNLCDTLNGWKPYGG